MWTGAAEAFKRLKHTMTTTLMLAMPNSNETFIIETNASVVNLCKEMLAIVEAI